MAGGEEICLRGGVGLGVLAAGWGDGFEGGGFFAAVGSFVGCHDAVVEVGLAGEFLAAPVPVV